MTGFDDSSDIDEIANHPTFQADLNQACKTAFKKYRNPYDSWQELAHEVFIKLRTSNAIAEYRKKTNARGYLYRIAVNHLIDLHRSRKHLSEQELVELEEGSFSRWTEEGLINELLTDEILSHLKDDDLFLIKSWLQGRSLKDIARDLKVSPTTISVRFARIIRKLQQLLKDRRR